DAFDIPTPACRVQAPVGERLFDASVVGHGAIISMMSEKTSGIFIVAALVVCAMQCGCAKTEEPKKTAGETKPVEYFHVDPATAASIRGKVIFTGVKPPKK